MIGAAWDFAMDALCRTVYWLLGLLGRSRLIPTAQDPDRPLLRQVLLWRGGELEIYLQHFDNPELPGFYHCHEWPRMRSVVLSGEFSESRYAYGAIMAGLTIFGFLNIRHCRFTTYTMTGGDDGTWHRSASWGPKCWTLFICSGGRKCARGYRARFGDSALGPFIPWREFVKQQVPSITGIETP